MDRYHFLDDCGTFELEQAENTSYLYFPVAGEGGIKSALTPNLGGDSKLGQNQFLLQPVSAEELHNNRSTRNFWCRIETEDGSRCWSAAGASAEAESRKFTKEQEQSSLKAGLMWQTVERADRETGLAAQITSFVPHGCDATEAMYVTIENRGEQAVAFTPVAAVPVYGRSADNIRDHRHVTALLHRIAVTEDGIVVTPTLSFDERGHQLNNTSYYVCGAEENGKKPAGFYPTVESFVGEGGSLTRPRALMQENGWAVSGNAAGRAAADSRNADSASALTPVQAGVRIDGYEAFGGIVFDRIVLEPGSARSYIILMGIADASAQSTVHTKNGASAQPGQKAAEGVQQADHAKGGAFAQKNGAAADPCAFGSAEAARAVRLLGTGEKIEEALAQTKRHWEDMVNVSYHTADQNFDRFMHWVSFQPVLRRIYGCSFLPHHDYGKGGRGWRDLWQDCLALLIMNPGGVREMLIDNFAGVRIDGTNATIIGSRQGEFIADRNSITRVWMDHGVWPMITTAFYINQTGDIELLLRSNTYFKDKQVCRGTETDTLWTDDGEPLQKDSDGKSYRGTILEHLLLQNLTAFYEVGEHNHIRLRGADWNDALDMAPDRGESVAFTAAYADNLLTLAGFMEILAKERNFKSIEIAKEMELLLTDDAALYDDQDAKRELLKRYTETCRHTVSGQKACVPTLLAAESLRRKGQWIQEHIRRTEWIGDGADGWFNGYYDNHGRQVERGGEDVRMMLTSQVFTVMSGTATEDQIRSIVRSADRYLYDGSVGGYRLNTEFGELKTDMGRMFGFAYGHKENGAVFSHMTTMFANALYRRGFGAEGHRALDALYRQAMNFPVSRIYPGIPEYFDPKGRGMYHYLTGAASWYMLTVITEMFGVKGSMGSMVFDPKLRADQFDERNRAELNLQFGGRRWHVVYVNDARKDCGAYEAAQVWVDGHLLDGANGAAVSLEQIRSMDRQTLHEVVVALEPKQQS